MHRTASRKQRLELSAEWEVEVVNFAPITINLLPSTLEAIAISQASLKIREPNELCEYSIKSL